MKNLLVSAFIIFSFPFFEKAAAAKGDVEVATSRFKISLSNSQKKITVKYNNAVYQIIKLEASSTNERKITIADFNFDGAEDISVSGDEGNVAHFSSVYLFSKKRGRFELNKQFSEIPCIAVDKTKKTLSGQCFHASACENWVEKYSVGKRNELNMIEKNGFFCEPTTDRSFKYTESYRNGKLIKNRITEINP
jgi:hypothetical protein